MRFVIHAAGTRGPETLLQTCETFAEALALFADVPECRSTYPIGETPEVDPRAPWAIVPTGTAEELAPLGNLVAIQPRYSGGCYILGESGGVSCLGFTVAERWRAGVGDWLRKEGAPAVRGFPSCCTPGSPEAFARYHATMAAGAAHSSRTGHKCADDLTPQLIGKEGKRVEVVDCYGERRRFYVGKSGGWRPCHLEIPRRNSTGGPAVSGAPFKSVSIIGER